MVDKMSQKMPLSGSCTISGARRRALIVLGMHRSGTSVLSALLCTAGADRPKNLVGGNEFNETGHWEPFNLPSLHDELLDAMGVAWHTPVPYPVEFLATPAAEPFRKRLADMLREEYRDSSLFCIKDPRTSRLMPFWIPVLRELEVEARFVIAVRNPVEVAASHARRDGMSLGVAMLLWLRYTIEAEVATRGCPRVFVTYDQLMTDWRGVLHNIGASLDVAWPRQMPDIEKDYEKIISDSLRHHHASRTEDEGDKLERWTSQVFAACVAAAEGATFDSAIVDRVEKEMRAASDIFGALPPPFVEQDATARIEKANALLAQSQERSAVLQGYLDAARANFENKCSEVARLTDRLRQIDHGRRITDDEFPELKGEFDDPHEAHIATRERLARLQYHVTELIGGMSVLTQRLASSADQFVSTIPEIEMQVAQMRLHLIDTAGHGQGEMPVAQTLFEPVAGAVAGLPAESDRLTILEAQVAQLRADLALSIEELEDVRQAQARANEVGDKTNAQE